MLKILPLRKSLILGDLCGNRRTSRKTLASFYFISRRIVRKTIYINQENTDSRITLGRRGLWCCANVRPALLRHLCGFLGIPRLLVTLSES